MTNDDAPMLNQGGAEVAALGVGRVDLWLADCREWDPNMLSQGLSCQEWERAKQFRFDADRSRFIIRRGLLRHLLARYTQIAAAQLSIQTTPFGRPFLAPGSNPSGIDFSLTRSRDLCLYAIARGPRVGIDMEHVDRHFDDSLIVRQFFALSEAEFLASVPANRQLESFYEMWTCKEACLKATGEGLTVSPATVVVSADPDGHLRTARAGRGSWSLMLFRPAYSFVAALATADEAHVSGLRLLTKAESRSAATDRGAQS